jgi:DNA-binding transcriptional regulator YhcF (GntR family)
VPGVSPRVQRAAPQHKQIADWLTGKILAGEAGYRPGDKLPSIRATAQEWGAGQQVAQRAYELLASARIVESRGTSGTFVAEPRNVLGPQQRARTGRLSDAERYEVRAAELVPATGSYAYVRPILGLGPGWPAARVIRREWRTFDSAGPLMLTVSWVPARYAQAVPELLEAVMLPDPRGAAYLIASRTGQRLTTGESAREARQVLDDGREAELLGLPADGHVLAETCTWPAGENMLEYTEFIVRENRVLVTEMEP